MPEKSKEYDDVIENKSIVKVGLRSNIRSLLILTLKKIISISSIQSLLFFYQIIYYSIFSKLYNYTKKNSKLEI